MKPASNIPQPVNQELLLPTAFPPMPRVMVDRFGTQAQEYEESLQTFWTRTRRVLADMYFQVAAPVNKVVEKTKETSDSIIRIEEVIITDAELVTIVTEIVGYVDAQVFEEKVARVAADGNLSGQYTLRVVAGAVVTGMKITSAYGPTTEISEIIFQTNVLKVQTATGPVITMMHIAANGIVFGTDLASDNYALGTAGWQLQRDTGNLNAMSGRIGGFFMDTTHFFAGTGATRITLTVSPIPELIIGQPSASVHTRHGINGFSIVNAANVQIGSLLNIGSDETSLTATIGNFQMCSAAVEMVSLSFNATSSIRFKENIRPIDGALALVGRLQGCRFDWKDEHAVDDIGLIAEEVHEVLPTIVGRDNESRIASLDYGKLTAVLVEAVKELAQRIDGLEHQISRH